MTPALELLAMYDALETRPADHVTFLALADWHEERGETAAAECFRWLVHENKAPFRYTADAKELKHHHESWHEGWYWWATSRERPGWGYSRAAVLPHRIWNKLTHSFNYNPLVFKEYATVRAAIEAIIKAWQQPTKNPRRPKG